MAKSDFGKFVRKELVDVPNIGERFDKKYPQFDSYDDK